MLLMWRLLLRRFKEEKGQIPLPNYALITYLNSSTVIPLLSISNDTKIARVNDILTSAFITSPSDLQHFSDEQRERFGIMATMVHRCLPEDIRDKVTPQEIMELFCLVQLLFSPFKQEAGAIVCNALHVLTIVFFSTLLLLVYLQ